LLFGVPAVRTSLLPQIRRWRRALPCARAIAPIDSR